MPGTRNAINTDSKKLRQSYFTLQHLAAGYGERQAYKHIIERTSTGKKTWFYRVLWFRPFRDKKHPLLRCFYEKMLKIGL